MSTTGPTSTRSPRGGGIARAERGVRPGNEVEREVPDVHVRHYFVLAARASARCGPADRPAACAWGSRSTGSPGSSACRISRRSGGRPRPGTLPAGTYWIPMAQPQKRWIQAMLGEDTYVAVPVLLRRHRVVEPVADEPGAAFSGAKLSPAAVRLTEPPGGRVAGDASRASYFAFRGDTGSSVAAAMALDRGGLSVGRLSKPAGGLPAGTFVVPAGGEAALAVSDAAVRYRLRVDARGGAVPTGLPFRQPKVALYAPLTAQPAEGATGPAGASGPLAEESLGHLRFPLDQVWEVPYTPVTGVEVTAGALSVGGFDVFVVPGISTFDLAPPGRRFSAGSNRAGPTSAPRGRVTLGGTPYAVSRASPPQAWERGACRSRGRCSGWPWTIRQPGHARGLGVRLLVPASGAASSPHRPTGANPGRTRGGHQTSGGSGYATGQDVLKGSAALVDEKLGAGHVVLFSGEPNYRAFTEGARSCWPTPSPTPRWGSTP